MGDYHSKTFFINLTDKVLWQGMYMYIQVKTQNSISQIIEEEEGLTVVISHGTITCKDDNQEPILQLNQL